MPNWCWRPRRRMWPIRRSPNCSCRPSTSPGRASSSRRAAAERPTEPEIWAAHLAVVEGETLGEPEIETDRARFLGRGRDVHAPSRCGRAPLVEHRGHRTGSGVCAPPPCTDPGGRDGAHGILDRCRCVPARRVGPRRQAPRGQRLRAGQHLGVDAGAGAAASPWRRR